MAAWVVRTRRLWAREVHRYLAGNPDNMYWSRYPGVIRVFPTYAEARDAADECDNAVAVPLERERTRLVALALQE